MFDGRFEALKHLLLWRHRALWSYRVDLFLLLLLYYLLCFGVFGMMYSYSIRSEWPEIEKKLTTFDDQQNAIKHLIGVARSRAFSDDEFQSLQKMVIIGPEDSMTKGASKAPFYLEVDSDALTKEQSSVLAEKLRDLTVFRLSIALLVERSSLIFLGGTVGSVAAILAALFPVVFLAFYILNVFYSRDTYAVLRHPLFILMMLELLSLIVLPIGLANFLEQSSRDFQNIIVDSGLKEPTDTRSPYNGVFGFITKLRDSGWAGSSKHLNFGMRGRLESYPTFTKVIEAFVEERKVPTDIEQGIDDNKAKRYFLSGAMMAVVGFISWIACALWIVRRFGGGLFVACSTAAAVIAVLLNLTLKEKTTSVAEILPSVKYSASFLSVGSADASISQLFAILIVAFGILFLVGKFSNFYRPYFLCTGFVGVVVASCALVQTIVSIRDPKMLTFCGLLLIVVVFVSAIEAAMRWAMFEFLYEPQR
jgi:hypothetical protein